MTGLFDGVSILLENGFSGSENSAGDSENKAPGVQAKPEANDSPGIRVRVGLTIPGSESGSAELFKGAAQAEALMHELKVVCFGTEDSDPDRVHREMELALEKGEIDSAVTFHYPFPLGTATVGLAKAPGNGRDIFIASTTGMTDTHRVKSLVKNALAGIAVAKAWGIREPVVGFLNLDGTLSALKTVRKLGESGYGTRLADSSRGGSLLRGNDILKGSVDVIVCDSLSGNVVIKLLAGYSTGGVSEVTGAGYGPGVGGDVQIVGIISRATSAPVVAGALVFSAKMAISDLRSVYRRELAAAEAAGLETLMNQWESGSAGISVKTGVKKPGKKTVDSEIEGVDVLELEDAVSELMNRDIYCEAGMGCTGPVVMVSAADRARAEEILKGKRLI
jgi:hypothetical protein